MTLIQAIALLFGRPAPVEPERRHGAPIALARKACLVLDHPADRAVFCHSGLLWITQFGSAKDTVLHAGQAVEISGHHEVTIQALHSSLFEIRGA